MAASIRQDFHSDLASVIATDIQYQRANYYYFLGKVEAWGGSDVPPGTPEIDSEAENTNIRANSLFIKKINSGDVSLVSKRFDWSSGVVYDPWDNTKNMRPLTFYCATSANRVYKCLSNNGGVPSTVEPTGTSFGITTTADGYVWKYMYSIPTFKQTKFTSGNFIPVQTSLSNGFYNHGAVEEVSVIAGGSGYSATIQTTISVSGATTGSGALGTVVVDVAGRITSVIITNGGSGYTAGANVAVTTAIGQGAILTPIIASGVITGMTIVAPGVGYVTTEPLSITVGGAVIVPSVNPATGTITKLNIVSGGAGYTGTPTLTVNTTGPGTGLYAHATALATSVMYGGKIVQANIVDPGQNYPSAPSTTITVSGDGTGAVFYPTIYGGKVIDVVVANSGQDYTYMNLTVVGTGTGAVLTPIVYASDFTSDQSIVEQTTVPGAIYNIVVADGGNNYSPATTITISGDGAGCTAVPTVVSGVITKVTVTGYGSGYSQSTITITDPNRTLVGSVIDAVLYAALPPIKGHGYDAISELYGETLVINSSLRQEASLNSLLQDYRQFGILKNPTLILTGKNFTDSTSLIVYKVQFQSVIGLVVDEVLLLGSVRYRVIAISGTTVTLQQLGTKYISPIGIMVAESSGTRSYNCYKVDSSPTVNKYSGRLLYVSDEVPFSFTADQGIVIKTFLKF